MREAEEGLALRYAGDGRSGRDRKKSAATASDSFQYTSGNEVIIQPINNTEKKGMSSFITMLIGLAVGCALMFVLVLPARIRSASSDMNEQMQGISDELTAKNADLEE